MTEQGSKNCDAEDCAGHDRMAQDFTSSRTALTHSDDAPQWDDSASIKFWHQVPVLLGLILLWMLLWGEFSLGTLITGSIISFIVVFVFYLPRVGLPGRINVWRTLIAAAVFAWDVVAASVKVAILALHFGYQPKNAVVKIQLRSREDFIMMLTAEAISLVPATIVVEQDRNNGILYLHALDVKDLKGVEQVRKNSLAQERRLILALGSDYDKSLIKKEDEEIRRISRIRYQRRGRTGDISDTAQEEPTPPSIPNESEDGDA